MWSLFGVVLAAWQFALYYSDVGQMKIVIVDEIIKKKTKKQIAVILQITEMLLVLYVIKQY